MCFLIRRVDGSQRKLGFSLPSLALCLLPLFTPGIGLDTAEGIFRLHGLTQIIILM